MRLLVLGADGFIGRHVREALSSEHEVFASTRSKESKDGELYIDLSDKGTIAKALDDIKPEVIISCAGVVENSEKAKLNVTFTKNLVEVAQESGLKFKRIIISGSAAEYGIVDAKDIPVRESTTLNANAGYGLSKLEEIELALKYGKEHGLPVVVARIFNPIGAGMHPRFLIPKLISQIDEIAKGTNDVIEVSRLDSRRDYIDVEDVAKAIKVLAESTPRQTIYNVGSGRSTSNGELIDIILDYVNLVTKPKIVESQPDPEKLVATQADITRISTELGWSPQKTIEQTVKEIVDDTRK